MMLKICVLIITIFVLNQILCYIDDIVQVCLLGALLYLTGEALLFSAL